MRKVFSYKFNLDTACVELCLDDGMLLCCPSTVPLSQVIRRTGNTKKQKMLSVNDKNRGLSRMSARQTPVSLFAKILCVRMNFLAFRREV